VVLVTVTFSDSPCSWAYYRTKSADTVVLSSANAEIIGLSEACCHLTWTRNLLKELGFKLSPTVV
jgi:hypothetical protein